MTKKKKENYYEDCWLYILLLTTLAILLESLKRYTFQVSGVRISFSIILLPIVFLLVNFIVKKYDYKKGVAAIAISAVMAVAFNATVSFALGEILILTNLTGEFCGYIVSQLVNITVYTFLLNNTKSPILLVYLNYIFSLVVFYMFYTLIYLNLIVLDNFWIKYFITLVIQSVICIPITIIDKRIKRGYSKV